MFPKTSVAAATVLTLLAGCASVQFGVTDDHEYTMHKISDACAAGIPNQTLHFLRQEATKFCATRKEWVVETASETQFGIPLVRCASATLRFRCSPDKPAWSLPSTASPPAAAASR